MNPQTHHLLSEIREQAGKEYGKLIQKLLAIAFLESGAEHLVDRSTQGIDLEIGFAGALYAIEVKTCEENHITLGRKDLEGLDRQLAAGANAYLAVLGGGLLDEWIFARYHPGELPSGKKISTLQLRPYRDRTLEKRIRSAFADAASRHGHAAVRAGQLGLDRVLAGYPGWKRA